MRSRSSEPTTSPEFQRLTGYLYALETHRYLPGLSLNNNLAILRWQLDRLGEPEPTQYEIDGMRDFYFGRAPVNLNRERGISV